jgi:hypothetical protein
MARTKTQNSGAAEMAAPKAPATRGRRAAATSAEVTVPATVIEDTSADGRQELAGQWLELATTTQRTAMATTRAYLETIERLPLVNRVDALKLADEFAYLVGHLAHMEYDALRSIMRSPVDVDVDVDVGVKVDALRKGVQVDVLSGGVNVLSREGTS